MNFEVSWTSNLIYLTLDSASHLKLSDLLETCSRMYSLQTLRLMLETKSPSPEGSLHYVNMPSLSTLVIECPFDVSLAFLDHITPAPGCSLKLSASTTPTELVAAQHIVVKFATNYFCHRSATSFQLVFNPTNIRAGDMGGFAVSIYSSTTIPTALFPLLLGTFEPAHASGVTTLRLVTCTSSLIHIINLLDGDDQQRPFPQINILKWRPDVTVSLDYTSLIVNFLATRRKLGMPIEIFNLTEWNVCSLRVPMDTKMLEEIPGLKVLWRDNQGEDMVREIRMWEWDTPGAGRCW
jgi:hypothetical protein